MTIQEISEFSSTISPNEELAFDGDMKALILWFIWSDGTRSATMIWDWQDYQLGPY